MKDKDLLESLLKEQNQLESRLKAVRDLIEIYGPKSNPEAAPKSIPPLKYKKGTLIKYNKLASNIKLFKIGESYEIRNRIESGNHLHLKYAVRNKVESISYLSEEVIDNHFKVN